MARRLLTYYGDDFTGSTDVMEALASAGVRTALFTRLPAAHEFEPFADYDAIGLAGTSRSQTPQWMDGHLPDAFAWLKDLDGRFCHYKVCSTFDSSPAVGNIGRAIEIGSRVFAQDRVPLVVGAPQLKRYTVFGHLFAGYQQQTYRIDRHPVISRHPVTPMTESDLRFHLAAQTSLPVTLVPANLLAEEMPDQQVDAIVAEEKDILLLDVMDGVTQLAAGRQLLRLNASLGPFVAGSSGIEYALVKALVERNAIPGKARFSDLPAAERIIVVSGSCSPTTARQIRHALAHGFTGIEVDPVRLVREPDHAAAIADETVSALNVERSAIVYTALDNGTKGDELDSIPGGRHRVGKMLGFISRQAIGRCGLRRAIIAGGDTSSHALAQLDVYALTTRLPLKATPGSPLCIGHSSDPALNGIEVAMKGGQVGHDDYFTALRDGMVAG